MPGQPPPPQDPSPFAAGPVTGARRVEPTGPAAGAGGAGTDGYGNGGVSVSAGSAPPAWPTAPGDGAPVDVITGGRTRRSPWAGLSPLMRYGLAAGGVLVLGVVLLLVLVLNGQLGTGHGLLSQNPVRPPDLRPPLAKLCPAPSAPAPPGNGDAAPPAGPRTVDKAAGISYKAYGTPWQTWPYLWRLGTLQVPYGVGQHFVTETYALGDYHASILSAAVPATVNDSTAIDIACVGQQVAADVRAEYYPQPNTMDLMRQGSTTIDGRPAWATKFRLHFEQEGLRAKSELVAVVLIDVGKPTAAVLYVSIPDTNPEWDYAVDDVVASVRVE
jgi:hypothetical protein